VGVNAGTGSSEDIYAGIIFLEDSTNPTTSNIFLAGIRFRASASSPSFEIGLWEFSAYNVTTPINSSSVDSLDDTALGGIFLQLQRTGGVRWNLWWSLDGISGWRNSGQLTNAQHTMSTWDAIGLGQYEQAGFTEGASFHFFRVQVFSASLPATGRFVYVETDPTASGLDASGTISGTGGGSSVGQFTQAFTDQTSISVAHNVGSLVHFTTVLDESNFVVDAQIQYGENTDEVTLSEIMSGSVVVLG